MKRTLSLLSRTLGHPGVFPAFAVLLLADAWQLTASHHAHRQSHISDAIYRVMTGVPGRWTDYHELRTVAWIDADAEGADGVMWNSGMDPSFDVDGAEYRVTLYRGERSVGSWAPTRRVYSLSLRARPLERSLGPPPEATVDELAADAASRVPGFPEFFDGAAPWRRVERADGQAALFAQRSETIAAGYVRNVFTSLLLLLALVSGACFASAAPGRVRRLMRWVKRRGRAEWACRSCGYDLRDLGDATRCPECGAATPPG